MPTIPDSDLREELETRLAAAVAQLRAAEGEVTRLKRHIQGVKEVISTLDHGAGAFDAGLFNELMHPGQPPKRSLARMSIKDAALTVLAERKQPMKVRDLFDAIQAGGKKIGGKVPRETLRAILRSYGGRFKKTPDAKWIIADSPLDSEG